ncbi:glycolate oxidase subunit [Bacillus cereus BDRD-ST26]|nr:glycolate oxidase subunit [Bacillus cereus BDRD-ST26]
MNELSIQEFLDENAYEYETDISKLEIYNYDAYVTKGDARFIIFPSSQEQFSNLVQRLNRHQIPYLIRASGTNYCGSVQAREEDIIISTIKIPLHVTSETERLFTVPASIRLKEINERISGNQKFYPPDPSSHNICTMGGTIAMNAGGAKCYMYGVTSNYIRTLKMLTPKFGEVLLGSKYLYALSNQALKHMVIGSEGTLGAFTESVIETQNQLEYHKDLVLNFLDYQQAIEFVFYIIENKLLTNSIDMSTNPYIPNKSKGVGAKLIIGIEHDDEETVNQKITYLKEAVSKFNGRVTAEGNLHELRIKVVQNNVKHILENTNKKKYFLFDTVVPRSRLKEIIDYFFSLSLSFDFPLLNTYHAGDGNIHPTVFYDPESEEEMEKLELFLFLIIKKAKELGGAISGEHGIGIEKKHLQYILSAKYQNKMYEMIKDYFDPNHLMNKGKMFSNFNDSQKYVHRISQLKNTYHITECTSLDYVKYEPVKEDGLKDVSVKEPFEEVNERLNKSELTIPYYPVINLKYSLEELVRLNIPSFMDNFYNLDSLIRAVEFEDSKTIGAKTLKNVEGYNLVPLCALFDGIKEYTIKNVFLEELYTRFYFYKIDVNLEEPFEILENEKVKKYLIDYYVCSNGTLILMFSKAIEHEQFLLFDVFKGENLGEYNTFTIISLKESLPFSIIKFKNWLYMNNERCLIVFDKEIDEIELNSLKPLSLSIRRIEDRKSHYIFLDEKLRQQINIQSQVEEGLKNELFKLC